MTIMQDLAISTCLDYLTIHEDETPTEIKAEKDLFIGKNIALTITINNEILKVQDIVNYGKLTIKYANPKNKLIARNIYNAGQLNTSHGEIHCKLLYQKPLANFREDLFQTLLFLFEAQKTTAKKMGLQSILNS